MAQTDKLPIWKAVKTSWSFAAVAWMPALPAYIFRALMTGFMLSAVSVSGESFQILKTLGVFLLLFAEIACLSLTLRLAVRGEYEGFFGIQVSGDEGRLLIAELLYIILIWFVVLISVFVAFNFASVFVSTTIADPQSIQDDEAALLKAITDAFQTPIGVLIALVLAFAAAIPVLYMMARLVTFSAATIGRKKIMIFETWSWTKGHAFQIMIAIVVAMLPFFVIYQLGGFMISSALGLGFNFLLADPEEVANVSKTQTFIYGAAISMLSMPINLVFSGLSAFMYNGFKPADEGASR